METTPVTGVAPAPDTSALSRTERFFIGYGIVDERALVALCDIFGFTPENHELEDLMEILLEWGFSGEELREVLLQYLGEKEFSHFIYAPGIDALIALKAERVPGAAS